MKSFLFVLLCLIGLNSYGQHTLTADDVTSMVIPLQPTMVQQPKSLFLHQLMGFQFHPLEKLLLSPNHSPLLLSTTALQQLRVMLFDTMP